MTNRVSLALDLSTTNTGWSKMDIDTKELISYGEIAPKIKNPGVLFPFYLLFMVGSDTPNRTAASIRLLNNTTFPSGKIALILIPFVLRLGIV